MNTPLREIITDAIRYWELRRIVYNIVLALTAITGYYSVTAAHREKITAGSISGLIILAVIANLLYCTAYIPDLVIQHSAYRETWKKIRIGLFIFGTLFAGLLTFLCVAPPSFN